MLDVLFVDPLMFVLARFVITIVVLVIVIGLIYYRFSGNSEYLFSFFVMGILIFLICAMLQTVKLELGMALGLFAIFAIIRFRTKDISFKDMTYFFTVIGVAVINALGNFQHPVAAPLLINGIIILSLLILEIITVRWNLSKYQMTYDRIDLLDPVMKEELLADLSARTRFKVVKVVIRKLDITKNIAEIEIYYNAR